MGFAAADVSEFKLSPDKTLENDFRFCLEPLPDLATLRNCWKAMDETGTHSFYLTWTWIGTWLQSLPSLENFMLLRIVRGKDTLGLAIVAFRTASFRGILSIKQAWLNATGNDIFDTVTIEHNGIATASMEIDEFLPLLERWFAEQHLVDEICIPGMETNVSREMGLRTISIDRRETGFRTSLDMPAAAETDMPFLSRNSRQQLQRAKRAYENIGPLTLTAASSQTMAEEYFAGFKDLHVQSWTRRGRPHAFRHGYFESFHRALIANGEPTRDVDLLRISAGNRAIGYLYNFRRNDTVYNYQSGFDDADPGLRPGYVSHALATSHYAKEGVRRYDFLAKANQLKQSFASETYELSWRQLRKPRFFFRAEQLARKLVRSSAD